MSCYLSSLIKAEDPQGYKKMADEGLMVGYPVKINGQSHREDNGVGFHTTVKFFDPKKDHAHSIHQIAQHLPLNPPDAKNTQIEPGIFPDRNGNDVHVIKLKGNSAEKMKEHNAKFSHMGHPTSYVFEPHVSVPKAVWDKIKSSGAKTASEAGIEFGNAELKRGPQTIKTYHHEPDSAEPRVPDEGDLTAKLNYEPQMGKLAASEKDSLCSLHKNEVVDDSLLPSLDNTDQKDEDAHALLNRKEDKYFLPRKFLERIVSELSTRLALGDIDTDTRYCHNKTIYMDDKDLTSFRDTVSKKVPRTKVRIRQYSPNNNGWEEVAYVEFKVKEDDGLTKKIRVRIPASFIDEISEGGKIVFDEFLVNLNRDLDRRVLENRVQAINHAIIRGGLHKQLETQYERRAYSGKNIRITIDDNLNFLDSRSIDPTVKDLIHTQKEWLSFLKPYITAAWDNPLILEVKTDAGTPAWLTRLLKEVNAEKQSFSKYSAAMITHLKTSEKDGKILTLSEHIPDEMNKSEKLESPLHKNEIPLEKKEKTADIAIVVLTDGNFILAGKRRKNGKWGLPGGRTEDHNENSKEAALRELEEETGLTLKPEDLTLFGTKEIKGEHESKRVYVYTANYPGGEPTTKEDPDREFTSWRWIRCEGGKLPDKILEGEMSPPAEAAFDELNMTKGEKLKPLMKPFVSDAQRRWGHTAAGEKALGGKAGVHEWDEATKGKKLPERVSKEEPLEKGGLKNAGIALGMAGALAGGAHTSDAGNRAPASIQQPKQKAPAYDHGKMMRALASVESSGGKNMNHKPLANGDVAYGKYALLPGTIKDTIKGHKDLKTKYGKALALTGQALHNYMRDNKGLEDTLADRHLSHIEHNFKGNPEHIGFAWNQGITGTKRALHNKQDISSHPYSKKIKEAYDKEK